MASFRKRKNGLWSFRVRFKDGNKWREKTGSGFKTKKEAERAASKVEDNKAHGINLKDDNALFSDYIEEWLETYKRPSVRPITYSLQERVVRLNLIPKFGNYKLKEINRTDYQRWINTLSPSYSIGTIRRIHSIMSSAINDAVLDLRILPYNPLQKIKFPIDTAENKLKHFSLEELNIFLEVLKTPQKNAKYQHSRQYFSLFTLMARTGLRIGETLALTWSDIDLENKRLRVNKTLVYPLNSTPYVSLPKTKKSEREINLDDHTVNILRSHRANQSEVVLMHQDFKNNDTLVFFQHEGKWLKTNNVREYFKVTCKRAGVPILSPHALRHSHAVHLLEAGANIKYVSKRLGHSSIKTTGDKYLHLTKKLEDEAISIYENYMQG